MFDTINGIPMHPLVVHGVVVLLPLAILGTIAIAVRPVWRAKYGPLVVLFAAVATVLMPVATQSGEQFEKRVGDPGEHAALGDQLIWFAIPLLVLSLALVVLDRVNNRTSAVADGTARGDGTAVADGTARGDGKRSSAGLLTTGVAVLAVVAGIASGVQVYRVGDSGAKAAWGNAGN
jgi:uncharacterized membrane protein